jgi:hypothetical protein
MVNTGVSQYSIDHDNAHAANKLLEQQQKQTNHINLGRPIIASQEDIPLGHCLDHHIQ